MADISLEKLRAGNRRFVNGSRLFPNQSPAHRQALATGQHPFAAILGCADSRVPPETIFDEGLGDLFTVRVAGNIVDNASLGSLEYAVQHLDVPLVVVLGHSGCGAVQAAMAGGQQPGRIATLVTAIQPALRGLIKSGETLDQALTNAVRSNIALVVGQLRAATPILAPSIQKGTIMVVGAYYDLGTGVVEFLL
jgi:carbonic anhydrase